MSAPKRFLLIRTDRLGDVVLTLPAVSLLRSAFPDAHVSMLLQHYTGAIVEGNPYVDSIVWYDDANGNIPFVSMVRRLRTESYDAAIVFHPTARIAWLLFLAGIGTRVGSGYRWYSFLFNRRVREHRKYGTKHELEHNLRLLEEIGCRKPEKYVPDFGITPGSGDMAAARKLLVEIGVAVSARYAVIHPGSGGSASDWPAERFGQLAKLLEQKGIRTIITGGPAEISLAGQVRAFSDGKATSVAGRLNLKELAAILKGAAVCVAPSTGPLHLAVAVGTPVVGLYPGMPPINAGRWGPYTSRGGVVTPHDGGNDLATVTVEEVFQAVMRVLAGHSFTSA